MPFRAETIATTAEEVRRRHAANRIGWNEGAVIYTEKVDETIEFLRAGGSNMHPIERENLGSLAGWCKTAVHLQCASGRDTLSLLAEGAGRVIGIDISDVHIDNARRIAATLGANASWHCCDVLDIPYELRGVADLVYTGRGSLSWLQDLDGWAARVAALLAPGGVFHVFDDHPVIWLFEPEATTLVASSLNYFHHAESVAEWPSTYIGDELTDTASLARKYTRLWNLGDIFSSLSRAGIEITLLREHAESYWEPFPKLEPRHRATIPMTFSMKGRLRP